MNVCKIPPPGWTCSRTPGHDGPCAARPSKEGTDLVWPSQVPGIPLNLRGGRQIDLRNPQPESIRIEDIAHALSNICRFAGHVQEFYSVAQHSILVSYALPAHLKLAGLLHDAAEAFLNDITRALKHADEMSLYRDLEKNMERVIFKAWDLPWPMDPAIKVVDNALAQVEYRTMLRDETLDRLRLSTTYYAGGAFNPDASIPFAIQPMTPRLAEDWFLHEFSFLVNARIRATALGVRVLEG